MLSFLSEHEQLNGETATLFSDLGLCMAWGSFSGLTIIAFLLSTIIIYAALVNVVTNNILEGN